MWTTYKQGGDPTPSELAPSRNWKGYFSLQMTHEEGAWVSLLEKEKTEIK